MHVTPDGLKFKGGSSKQARLIPEARSIWNWAITAAVGVLGGAVGAYLAARSCNWKKTNPKRVRHIVTGGNSKAPDEKLEVLEVVIDNPKKADPYDPRPRDG